MPEACPIFDASNQMGVSTWVSRGWMDRHLEWHHPEFVLVLAYVFHFETKWLGILQITRFLHTTPSHCYFLTETIRGHFMRLPSQTLQALDRLHMSSTFYNYTPSPPH